MSEKSLCDRDILRLYTPGKGSIIGANVLVNHPLYMK
jgi:hypothetical protein